MHLDDLYLLLPKIKCKNNDIAIEDSLFVLESLWIFIQLCHQIFSCNVILPGYIFTKLNLRMVLLRNSLDRYL